MTVEVVLQDRVRDFARHLQLMQDVAGVAVLAPAAWARVQTGHVLNVGLGLLEVCVIGAAVLSAVRELRGSEEDGSVAWTDLFMGAVLLIEWAFRLAGDGKIISPPLVAAMTALALAALPRLRARLKAGRRMTLDDEGVRVRITPLRRLRVAWSDVEAIEDGEGRVSFVLRNGSKRRLGLKRYRNGAEIRAAIADAARQAGVTHTTSSFRR